MEENLSESEVKYDVQNGENERQVVDGAPRDSFSNINSESESASNTNNYPSSSREISAAKSGQMESRATGPTTSRLEQLLTAGKRTPARSGSSESGGGGVGAGGKTVDNNNSGNSATPGNGEEESSSSSTEPTSEKCRNPRKRLLNNSVNAADADQEQDTAEKAKKLQKTAHGKGPEKDVKNSRVEGTDGKKESGNNKGANPQDDLEYMGAQIDRLLKMPSSPPAGNRRKSKSDEDQNKFKCKMCSKTYVSEDDFRSHSYDHTGETPLVFACTRCNKKTRWKATVISHVQTDHRGDVNAAWYKVAPDQRTKSFMQTCMIELDSAANKNKTSVDRKGKDHSKPSFECSFSCGAKFTTITAAMRHEKSWHPQAVAEREKSRDPGKDAVVEKDNEKGKDDSQEESASVRTAFSIISSGIVAKNKEKTDSPITEESRRQRASDSTNAQPKMATRGSKSKPVKSKGGNKKSDDKSNESDNEDSTKEVKIKTELPDDVPTDQTPPATPGRTSLRRNIQKPKWLTDADLVTDYEVPRGTNSMRTGLTPVAATKMTNGSVTSPSESRKANAGSGPKVDNKNKNRRSSKESEAKKDDQVQTPADCCIVRTVSLSKIQKSREEKERKDSEEDSQKKNPPEPNKTGKQTSTALPQTEANGSSISPASTTVTPNSLDEPAVRCLGTGPESFHFQSSTQQSTSSSRARQSQQATVPQSRTAPRRLLVTVAEANEKGSSSQESTTSPGTGKKSSPKNKKSPKKDSKGTSPSNKTTSETTETGANDLDVAKGNELKNDEMSSRNSPRSRGRPKKGPGVSEESQGHNEASGKTKERKRKIIEKELDANTAASGAKQLRKTSAKKNSPSKAQVPPVESKTGGVNGRIDDETAKSISEPLVQGVNDIPNANKIVAPGSTQIIADVNLPSSSANSLFNSDNSSSTFASLPALNPAETLSLPFTSVNAPSFADLAKARVRGFPKPTIGKIVEKPTVETNVKSKSNISTTDTAESTASKSPDPFTNVDGISFVEISDKSAAVKNDAKQQRTTSVESEKAMNDIEKVVTPNSAEDAPPPPPPPADMSDNPDEDMPILRPETTRAFPPAQPLKLPDSVIVEHLNSVDEDVRSTDSPVPQAAPVLSKEANEVPSNSPKQSARSESLQNEDTEKIEVETAHSSAPIIDECSNENEEEAMDIGDFPGVADEDDDNAVPLRGRDRSDSLSMRSCGSGSQSEKIKGLDDSTVHSVKETKEASTGVSMDNEYMDDSDSNDSLMSEFSELAAQVSEKQDGVKLKEDCLRFIATKVSSNAMWEIRKELKKLKKNKDYFKFGKLTPLAAGLMHDIFCQSLR